MEIIKKFEDFLDRMQGLLDNAKKQGHIIVRVEDLENTFPELKESEDNGKPNGGIVLEDFNGGEGFYKVHLDYLNKEQVEEIERLVKRWNPELKESEDEVIRKKLIDAIQGLWENDALPMPLSVVREKAAIAAMQGMLSNPAICLADGDTYPKVAVEYADALIEELQKK